MAETSIQRARRLAREKRERDEAAAKAAAKKPAEKPKKEGFFSAFRGRGESIDSAVEAAEGSNQERDAKDKQ